MNIKAFFAMPLAFLTMLFSLAFPPQAREGIAAVYVSHVNASARTTHEFKLDLIRKNSWEHSHFGVDPCGRPRNPKGLFEGYCFAGRLEDGKIAAFLEAAGENGFAEWEGQYTSEEPLPVGGGVWYVTIVFADGSEKESHGGSLAHPEGWAEMGAAFEALMGNRVL